MAIGDSVQISTMRHQQTYHNRNEAGELRRTGGNMVNTTTSAILSLKKKLTKKYHLYAYYVSFFPSFCDQYSADEM